MPCFAHFFPVKALRLESQPVFARFAGVSVGVWAASISLRSICYTFAILGQPVSRISKATSSGCVGLSLLIASAASADEMNVGF